MSVAAATTNVAVDVVDTPMLGVITVLVGHVKLGGALSTIDSANVHVAMLLALSVAEHVTVDEVPVKNRVTPESGHFKLAIPDPSVALTLLAKLTSGSGRLSVACVVYV